MVHMSYGWVHNSIQTVPMHVIIGHSTSTGYKLHLFYQFHKLCNNWLSAYKISSPWAGKLLLHPLHQQFNFDPTSFPSSLTIRLSPSCVTTLFDFAALLSYTKTRPLPSKLRKWGCIWPHAPAPTVINPPPYKASLFFLLTNLKLSIFIVHSKFSKP